MIVYPLPLAKSLILLVCSIFTAYLCQGKSRHNSTPSWQKFLRYWYRSRYVKNPRVANLPGYVFGVCGSTNRELLLLAKSLQSCPTLVRPQRWQPTRLPRPWDSPGKNTGVGWHFLLQCMNVKSKCEVVQSCPTFSDPRDCSLPGSSVHGIFQARVLEWVAIAFSMYHVRLVQT